MPLLLQHEIAEALPEDYPAPALVIEGEPSTASGAELDTWEVLSQAHTYMKEHGLSKPMLVGQAYHVGRGTRQAKTQGMNNVIVPTGLPREFDPESTQKWTRSRKDWLMRENPIGFAVLKYKLHRL